MPAHLSGPARTITLLALLTSALAACDQPRPQVLLVRGTPESTPTSARVLPSTATPSATLTVVPTAVVPMATATPKATATPTRPPDPTATAVPTPIPTATPEPAPTATATPQARIHVVRAGETLATIARLYGTSATAIARLNGLSNPNRIYVGQRLLIP